VRRRLVKHLVVLALRAGIQNDLFGGHHAQSNKFSSQQALRSIHITKPYPHPVTATVPFFMLEPMALMLPLTYSDVLTKTGLGYTLSLATVAPTIPAFPVIGPNNFLVSISLFCSLHTYPPVSALLNPTTAALVPRPVGSSTLLLVVLILLSVLQVA
jgi:hypothetical protein